MIQSKTIHYMKYLFLVAVIALCSSCVEEVTTWEQISRSGKLRFVTIESPLTCHLTSAGYAGMDCDLARRYADEMGVELVLILVKSPQEAMQMVAENRADIGGAGLMNSLAHESLVLGPAWDHAALQLIYRSGTAKPKSLENLREQKIPVMPEQLELLERTYPLERWRPVHAHDISELLRKVQDGETGVAVADSRQFSTYRHLYPSLRVAFPLTAPQRVAWFYRKDAALDETVSAFISEQYETGDLEVVQEQYFGHTGKFDFSDASTFLVRVRERLPEFQQLFKDTAFRYGIDWTLLAAMCYQESHWFPDAKSYTGVRGLMMLTEDTAHYLDIGDRVDPRQSVEGGARYFRLLLDRIPERITDPDRTWLALAAYNIGYYHLEDARILTQSMGGDPDKWVDIRKNLPLLSDHQWQLQSAYGPARGGEAVRFVDNIRRYQNVLFWLHAGEEFQENKHRTWMEGVALVPVSVHVM